MQGSKPCEVIRAVINDHWRPQQKNHHEVHKQWCRLPDSFNTKL